MKSLIWNRRPVGLTATLTFLDNRKIKVCISEKVLNLCKCWLDDTPGDYLDAVLIGNILHGDNCFELNITRVDRFYDSLTTPHYLSDEIHIKVRLLKPGFSVKLTDEFAQVSSSTLFSSFCEKLPSMDMQAAFCCVAKAYMAENCKIVRDQFDIFEMSAIVPDCPLVFKPVESLPFITCALSRSLETGICASTTLKGDYSDRYDIRYGYLSVNASHKFAIHLDTEPNLSTNNLAGIWISGVDQATDPKIWLLCMRFILYSHFPNRYLCSHVKTPNVSNDCVVSVPNVSMFLALYSRVGGPPQCFEVDWGIGDQHHLLMSESATNAQRFISSNGTVRQLNFFKFASSINLSTCRGPTGARPEAYHFSLQPKCVSASAVAPRAPRGDQRLRSQIQCELPSVTELSLLSTVSEQHIDDLPCYLSDLRVPEASLLLEEGVAVSCATKPRCSMNNNNTDQCDDAIPRQLPSSTKPATSSACLAYDPQRYIGTAPPVDHVAAPRRREVNLHALLASLSPGQLLRLEQAIAAIHRRQPRPERETAQPDGVALAGNRHETLAQAIGLVEVGVNTTMLCPTSPVVVGAGIGQPSAVTGVSGLSPVRQDRSTEVDASFARGYVPGKVTGEPTEMVNCAVQVAQSVATYPPTTTTEPLLGALYCEENKLTSSLPEASTDSSHLDDDRDPSSDRYVVLLNSIRDVLSRRPAPSLLGLPPPPTPQRPDSSRRGLAGTTTCAPTACDQTLGSTPEAGESNPVTDWLRLGNLLFGVNNNNDQEAEARDLQGDCKPSPGPARHDLTKEEDCHPTQSPNSLSVSSSLESTNFCDYKSMLFDSTRVDELALSELMPTGSSDPRIADELTATTTTTTMSFTDTDQSVFLSSLVRKYLGTTGHRNHRQDVSLWGGLSPANLSMDTRAYLCRHGIGQQANRDANSSRPSTATAESSQVPNLLEGLQLERSPLACHDPDMKLLLPPPARRSPSSSTTGGTSLSDATLTSHSSPPGDGENNVRILDLHRLRTLPKLL